MGGNFIIGGGKPFIANENQLVIFKIERYLNNCQEEISPTR